jgi:hypothetical protein
MLNKTLPIHFFMIAAHVVLVAAAHQKSMLATAIVNPSATMVP